MPWTAVLGEGFQTPYGAIRTPPWSNYTGLAYSLKMKPYALITKISPSFLLSKKQSRQLSWSTCSQIRMGPTRLRYGQISLGMHKVYGEKFLLHLFYIYIV